MNVTTLDCNRKIATLHHKLTKLTIDFADQNGLTLATVIGTLEMVKLGIIERVK